MATTYTFPTTPISGGTINTAESIWLGGTRFFMVFDQTGPAYEMAAVIDASGDLYTSGTTVSSTTQIVTKSNSSFTQPCKLMKLDASTILCIYSNSVSANALSTGLTLNARVYQIDSSNNINIVFDAASVAPPAFMNSAPSAVASSGSSTVNLSSYSRFVASYSCSAFTKVADDHIVAVTREYSSLAAVGSTSSALYKLNYYDIQWNPTSATLAITLQVPSSASYSEAVGYAGAYAALPAASWHTMSITTIPNTSQVLYGENSLTSLTIQSFTSDTTATATGRWYTIDYTSTANAPTTLTGVRTGAVLIPLDANRILEVGGITIGGNIYARLWTSGTWSVDIPIDTSLVTSNNYIAAIMTVGPPQQALALGNDHVLLAYGSQRWVSSGNLQNIATYGVFRLIGTTVLQAAPYGLPFVSTPTQTFYRGLDAYVPRTALDGTTASPYDYYRKSGALAHTFLRYVNPS